ncbi:MAG: DUF2197 domain-containing protein [Symbiobacteriia bacterium]
MWVQCVLCDRYVEISDETAVAKRFKKRPDFAFLCSNCGGGLGELELNSTPPGVLPEVLAASGRGAEPAFAAWSEPTKPRLRHRREDGGSRPLAAAGRETQPLPVETPPPPRAPGEEQARQQSELGQPRQQGPSVLGRPGQGQPGQGQPGQGQPGPGAPESAGGGRHRRRRGRSGKPPVEDNQGNGIPNNGQGGSTGGGQNHQGSQGQHGSGHGQRGRGGAHGNPKGQQQGQGKGPRNGSAGPRSEAGQPSPRPQGDERRPPVVPQPDR